MTLIHGNSANATLGALHTYEVIVTDDGSLSTAERMIREEFPWAVWVCGPKRGPAANRNHGATKAGGDWLVFVDDDCVPERTFLAAYSRASAVQDYDVLEGMTRPQGDRLAADMVCPANISGGRLWSCNFAIRRCLFSQLGGFDENFLAPAMEDIEIQTRILKAGYITFFVSDARVTHPWRTCQGLKFLRSCARSIVYFVHKHPEKGSSWSMNGLLKRAGVALILQFPKNLVRFKGRGVFRALFLELAFLFFITRSFMERHSFDKARKAR
jgi:GT2 family glycosyltransferase